MSHRPSKTISEAASCTSLGLPSTFKSALPFLPAVAARTGLRRVLAALRPGGWMLTGCHELDTDSRANAMTWLTATLLGGNHFTSTDTITVLEELSYTAITQPPSPPGTPPFVLARRP
jgi:hypothetical protein